jgi:Spy/CpxP family protein refolding chaperone
MRRTALVAIAALALAACSNETTAPTVSDLTIDAGAYGTSLTLAGGYEPEIYQSRLTNGLPDSLRLTDEQQAQIKALIDAFNTATKADREALEPLLKQAHQVMERTRNADSVSKILAQALVITQRLTAAQAKLQSDINNVLTADQRAWLASHEPRKCNPTKFAPLTDAQKAQIKALEQAFQTTNKTDLDAVKTALDSAKGKSAAERQAILTSVQPAMQRLEAARKALRTAIEGVLTADQKSSGCLPLG